MNNQYIVLAINESKKAIKSKNIPVGAVIVKNDKVISRAYNKKNSSNSPIDHAEIIAIKKACKKLHSWHLEECVMYVTLKPCDMCSGAIKEARIKKVYYLLESTYYKNGKEKTNVMYFKDEQLKLEYKKILKDFFTKLR